MIDPSSSEEESDDEGVSEPHHHQHRAKDGHHHHPQHGNHMVGGGVGGGVGGLSGAVANCSIGGSGIGGPAGGGGGVFGGGGQQLGMAGGGGGGSTGMMMAHPSVTGTVPAHPSVVASSTWGPQGGGNKSLDIPQSSGTLPRFVLFSLSSSSSTFSSLLSDCLFTYNVVWTVDSMFSLFNYFAQIRGRQTDRQTKRLLHVIQAYCTLRAR